VSGHAKGPWNDGGCRRTEAGERRDIDVEDARGCRIATVRTEPDARLVIAAPELLELLEKLDGWLAKTSHDDDHPWRVSIREAVAKAKGRDV
jgi:hypothetical protein